MKILIYTSALIFLFLSSSCSSKHYGHLSKVKVHKNESSSNELEITKKKSKANNEASNKKDNEYQSQIINNDPPKVIDNNEASTKLSYDLGIENSIPRIGDKKNSNKSEAPAAKKSVFKKIKDKPVYKNYLAPLLTKGEGQVDAFALVGFIAGIISLLVLPFIFGVIAIIFSSIGLSRIMKNNSRGKGFAIAGLVLGIIGVIWALAVAASL
jgi:hypothetical protein